MKMYKMPPGTAVSVKWLDSVINFGWSNPRKNYPPQTISSLGYVVSVGKDMLTLTTAYSSHQGGILSPLSIPWVSITELEEVPEHNIT